MRVTPLNSLGRLFRTTIILGSLLLTGASAKAQVGFNFTLDGSVPQNVIDGFNDAGDLWSSLITTPVTLEITIGFESLGGSTLGSASSSQFFVSYSSYRSSLVSSSTSSFDTTALANLPDAASFDVSYNYLKVGETAASATPTAGSTNRLIVNQSILRALGSTDTYANPDASITFSSDYSFDFDRSDGITAGQFDFVGVAAHEIGHALGFGSITTAIDSVALTDPFDATAIDPSALDLFRFSANGVRDISVGTAAFFSLDGGLTSIGALSTGVNTGDGRQGSHWLDNTGLGLMDPTLAAGELGTISTNDLKALDAIGWSVGQFSPVPEPLATTAILGLTAFFLAGRRRNVRRSSS